jgi:hypothetical protein
MSRPPDDEQRKLAEATEKQLELPPGLLQRYLDNGGQIDAKQRAMVLDAYGIDPKLSKRNAVDAVGLALQDALQRNNGDPAIAIAELHGGQDRSKWNKGVNDFAARVSMPPPAPRPAGRRSASGMQMQAQAGNRSASGMTAPAPQQSPPVVGETPADPVEADAQQSMMPDEEIAVVEARNAPPAAAPVQAAPVGAPPAGEGEAVPAGPKTLDAYRTGAMSSEDKAEFERLVQAGALTVPADFQVGAVPMEKNLLEKAAEVPSAIKEAVTGEKRRTAETEAAPDWSQIPEWEDLGTLKNIAAAAASPREALQILQSNFPGMKVREDEKGNLFAFSPKAGKEFAVKPGLDFGDVVRAGAVLPIYAATAATGGLPAIMGREALVQTGIEATQAATGGEFNPLDIALAAATPAALRAGGAVKNAAGSAIRRAGAALGIGGADSAVAREAAQAAAPVASDVAGEAATTTLRDVGPTGIGGARAAAPVAEAAQAAPSAPIDQQQLASVLKRAIGTGDDAVKAKQELAQAFNVDKDLAKRAEYLGFDLPADVLSDSRIIKENIGGLRSKVGSDDAQAFAETVQRAVDVADENMAKLGADASPDAVSNRVFKQLDTVRADLDDQAGKLYKSVDAVVPMKTPASMGNVERVLQKRLADLGGDVSKLSAKERELLKLVEGTKPGAKYPTTYQSIRDEKELVRLAKRGLGDYATAGDARNDSLYRALVDDQIDTVARAGGAQADELVMQLKTANQLTAKQKAIEEKIVSYFGDKEGRGSIAPLMDAAIRGAKKGDQTKLLELLDVVPKELHPEVLMTAMSQASRAKGGAVKGQFGFAEFDSLYRDMRRKGNEEIYKRVAKALGPERAETLRALAEISKRMTEARALQLTTGKGNQIPKALELVGAQSLISRILQSAPGKAAAVAGGGMVGNAILPGIGAAAGGAGGLSLLQYIAKGGKEAVEAAGKLIVSPEIKALTTASASGAVDTPAVKEAVRKVALSKPFRDWWKAAQGASMKYDPKGAERWILAAMQAAQSEREQ